MVYQNKPRSVIQEISSTIQAIRNCEKSGNAEWKNRHEETIETIQKQFLPHGSGIDNGCKIDIDKSTGDKVVVTFSFHCMDDNGYYCGWIDYRAIITPSFHGISLKISGKDYNGLKDYLYETIGYALSRDIAHTWDESKGESYQNGSKLGYFNDDPTINNYGE